MSFGFDDVTIGTLYFKSSDVAEGFEFSLPSRLWQSLRSVIVGLHTNTSSIFHVGLM